VSRLTGIVLASFLLFGGFSFSPPSPKYKVIYVEEERWKEDHLSLAVFVSSKTKLQSVEEFQAMVCTVLREVRLSKLKKFGGLKYDRIDQYPSGFAIRVYYDFDDYLPRGPSRHSEKVLAKATARYLGIYSFDGDTETGAIRWFVGNPKGWQQPLHVNHMAFCGKSGMAGSTGGNE